MSDFSNPIQPLACEFQMSAFKKQSQVTFLRTTPSCYLSEYQMLHASTSYLKNQSSISYLKVSSSQSLLPSHSNYLDTYCKKQTVKHFHLDDQEKHLYLSDKKKYLHLDDQVKHLYIDDKEEHLHLDDKKEYLHLDDKDKHLHLDDKEEHLNLDDKEEHLNLNVQVNSPVHKKKIDITGMIKEFKSSMSKHWNRGVQGLSDLALRFAIQERDITVLDNLISWAIGYKQKNLYNRPFSEQLNYIGFKKREVDIAIFVKSSSIPNREIRVWRELHRNDGLDSLIKCIISYREGKFTQGTKETNYSKLQRMGMSLNLINYLRTVQVFKVTKRIRIRKSPNAAGLVSNLGHLQVGEIVEGQLQGEWLKHYKGWSLVMKSKKLTVRRIYPSTNFDSLIDTIMNVSKHFSKKDYQKLLEFSRKEQTQTGRKVAQQEKVYQAEWQRRKQESRQHQKFIRHQSDLEYKKKMEKEREIREEENRKKREVIESEKLDRRWREEQEKRRIEEERESKERQERERRENQERQERERQEREEKARKQKKQELRSAIKARQQKYGLSDSWDIRFSNGAPYFINHVTKQTQWDDPRPLPDGWSKKTDQYQRPYFENFITKKTQWMDPRPPLIH